MPDEPGPDLKKLASEVEIEFLRGSGPGGQNRNKVETAVRVRHLPTGIVVTCCAERSQARNRSIAMKRLAEILKKRARKPRPRVPTRKSRAARERELAAKKKHAAKKQARSSTRRTGPSEPE